MTKPPETVQDFHCPTCGRLMLHVRRVRFDAPELYEGYQPKRREVWLCMTCGCENVGAGVRK